MDPNEDWSGNTPPIENTDVLPEDDSNADILPGYASFDDYLQEAFDAIRAGIKAANNLPNGANYNYYTCFPSFNDAKNKDIKTLSNAMQNIMCTAGTPGRLHRRDVEEKFDLLLETNDIFLDRANTCMDEECGIIKNTEVQLVVSQANRHKVNGSWNADNVRLPEKSDSTQSVRLLAGKNIQRPQLMFTDKIDNGPKPWCPRIKDKPNSRKPLALYLEEGEEGLIYNHPYECELDGFVPPESQLKKREPVKYKSLEETAIVMIEKAADVKLLLEDLKNYKEIAIDLEHHSYRTFQGITCLMQISTGDTDYLVDTLSLRSELHQLNEIFTKPTILKVFHGADLDIQWLQRDLSLYIVNMFDTHQAAKQLNLPYLSLAFLLKRYCNIDPNKHFQLADWRIRPLPEELIKYAREDTHYLLHIKDILTNDLIDLANGQTNVLKAVYDRSTEICKTTYVKPIWTEESYLTMYRKSQKMFNNKQLYALKELHKWRDTTAREEDDSMGYVLPNHMLLNIAETLPREMQGILACCNPIPPLVRQNLLKLHKIILKAREEPLIKPVLEDDLRQRMTQRNQNADSEAWTYSPHDIPSGMEPRADLPCLLDNLCAPGGTTTRHSNAVVQHMVTVFDSPPTSEDEDCSNKEKLAAKRKKKFVFVSPFERYKRVLPMVAEQEAREREMQRQQEDERLNKLKKEEEDTTNSINRVHEHYKKVYQSTMDKIIEGKKERSKRAAEVPLGQMHGRKKKKTPCVNWQNEMQEKSSNDLSTPAPSLNSRVFQAAKRGNDTSEMHSTAENSDSEAIKPLRQRVKGEKKANQAELSKHGMLPMTRFDYKSVDFGSFQGGSKNNPGQVTFEQPKAKNKDKKRKRKKQKINI